MVLIYEFSWQEAEGRIRKQSNAEIAYIATNPFKLVVNHKSAHKDEWAQMNTNQAAKGVFLPRLYLAPQFVVNFLCDGTISGRAGIQKDHEQKRLNVKRQEGFRRSLAAQLEEAEQRRATEQLAKQAEAQKLAEDAHKYQASPTCDYRDITRTLISLC
jgi:hypothetical protein